MNDAKLYMQIAIRKSIEGMRNGKGGPFGAVVVKDGEIIAEGFNEVTSSNDPTAHAEVVAIRKACAKLKTFQLSECEIYTSCEPCPMCMGAIYWARPAKVYYANTKSDAASAGFDDKFIEEEFFLPINQRKIPMEQIMREEAIKVFEEWKEKGNKIGY